MSLPRASLPPARFSAQNRSRALQAEIVELILERDLDAGLIGEAMDLWTPEHRGILEAAKAGDKELASERLRRHFDGIREQLAKLPVAP